MTKLILCLLLCGLGSNALAQATPEASKSPGAMSPEERGEMMQAANAYNTCLYTQAMENLAVDEDIRRVADIAMGACQPGLSELDGKIAGWGYPAYFASRFTQNVRDRAIRKLLPELAIRKSQ